MTLEVIKPHMLISSSSSVLPDNSSKERRRVIPGSNEYHSAELPAWKVLQERCSSDAFLHGSEAFKAYTFIPRACKERQFT